MESEIKLKFKSNKELLEAASSDWFAGLLINKELQTPVLLENSYRDTANHKLISRGAMIRVRHYSSQRDAYEFTLKYSGNVSGGLHQRYEWNVRSDTGVFDVDGFREAAKSCADPYELLEEALDGITNDELTEICSNSFYRIMYDISYGDSMIEACVDYGDIRNGSGKVVDNVCELELELVSGDVKDIESLGDYIISVTGCEPFELSKFQRTFAACEDDGV